MIPVVEAKAWTSPDTVKVARELLGHWLVARSSDGSLLRARITETEAYHGPEDRACHASKGRTARTEVMYGPGGRWYVYLCYGIHEMLNLVTGPADWPAAVLIRAVEGVTGPGRVTKTFGIGRKHNGLSAASSGTGLWIERRDSDLVILPHEVLAGPRVGIDYAGTEWAAKPWRFRWMSRWTTPGGRSTRPKGPPDRAAARA